MFIISKLLELATTPSNVVGICVVIAALAALLRIKVLFRVMLTFAVIGFVAFGWLPAGNLALTILESRFPQPTLPADVTGIVMIGGAVDVHLTHNRGQPSLNEAGERVTETLALMRRYPGARVILSGGGSDIADADHAALSESEVAKTALVEMGVAPERLELEEVSKTTCENAIESRRLANPAAGDLWILVTSASQMPRAVACFRKQGFDVVPFPVDYRTKSGVRENLPCSPRGRALPQPIWPRMSGWDSRRTSCWAQPMTCFRRPRHPDDRQQPLGGHRAPTLGAFTAGIDTFLQVTEALAIGCVLLADLRAFAGDILVVFRPDQHEMRGRSGTSLRKRQSA